MDCIIDSFPIDEWYLMELFHIKCSFGKPDEQLQQIPWEFWGREWEQEEQMLHVVSKRYWHQIWLSLCNNGEAHYSKRKAFSDWLTGNIHKYQIYTLVQISAGYALRYLTHRICKVLYFKESGNWDFLKSANSIAKKYNAMFFPFFSCLII